MPDEIRLLLAFALSLGAAYLATPRAIALAHWADFHADPVPHRSHRVATPYLGGAAVIGGFMLAALTLGGDVARLAPIPACAFGLWVLGTLDDRASLPPLLRLGVEGAAALALWAAGLGWDLFGSDAANLALTIVWTLTLTNAFNFMDNVDGAAATVASAASAAVGLLAALEGDLAVAALSFGLTGACAGFLPYNLARPSRIFLGDGGSLPIGFVVAALIMVLPVSEAAGLTWLLAVVLFAGLPVVDTALVMISRRRAGVPLLIGGSDHIAHRLATRVASPRAVAFTLGAIQAVLGAVAIGVIQLGQGSIVSAWTIWFVTATAAVVILETRAWAPDRGVAASLPERLAGKDVLSGGGGPRRHGSPTVVERGAIVLLTAACGLSPALFGFYRLSVWGPIALFALAGLLGLVIARPAAPRPAALVAVGGVVALWLWSLLSIGWSESADQALLEANRWMLYAALLAVLVLLLRDDGLGKVLIGTATAAVVIFGLYLCVRLMFSGSEELFLEGRVNEPLGYVNGQAAYLLLGLWPLVAVAERARAHAVSGLAVGAATLLGGLALLSQSRALVPALVVSAVVLLTLLPGRRGRLWALVAISLGVAVAAGPLLEVYDGRSGSDVPDPDDIRTAAVALLGAAVLCGTLWALARWVSGRAVAAWPKEVGRASSAGLAALGAVLIVGGLLAVGNPVAKLSEEARAFKNLEADSPEEGGSRLISGGGNRYDFWRVGINQFKDDPVKGIGAGNYDRTYFLERRVTQDVRQAHSLPLQVLGELGLIGGLGLLTFVGAILVGFIGRARAARASGRDLGLAVAGGGMFLVWLVHTSVDWLHLIPGVTGIALCGAAVLVAPWTRTEASGSPSRWRPVVIGACGLLVLAGALLVGRAALADKYRSEAEEIVQSDPRQALRKAADSLALNDEALSAYIVQASAYARLNDYRRARGALLEATRREPHDFVTWALLGDLALRRGDLSQARRDYRQASRLNPLDEGLKRASRDPRTAVE